MNRAFPLAQVIFTTESIIRAKLLNLPDPGDVHVIAAALSVGANAICTNNLRDFPPKVLNEQGLCAASADDVISELMTRFPDQMGIVHQRTVAGLIGATNESTLDALSSAQAKVSSRLMRRLISTSSE